MKIKKGWSSNNRRSNNNNILIHLEYLDLNSHLDRIKIHLVEKDSLEITANQTFSIQFLVKVDHLLVYLEILLAEWQAMDNINIRITKIISNNSITSTSISMILSGA